MTSGYLKFSSNFVLSHWRCNPATFCTCIIHLFSPIPNPQTYLYIYGNIFACTLGYFWPVFSCRHDCCHD